MPNSIMLDKVEGHPGRRNTMLVTVPNVRITNGSHNIEQHVLFFPGDVQNMYEKMCDSFCGRDWKDWSYEAVSAILCKKFPLSIIWLVHPSRIHDQMFSCYDNFLECSIIGAPESHSRFEAIEHIDALLKQGCELLVMQHLDLLNEKDGNQEVSSKQPLKQALLKLPVSLIGFSKGCVVLNQFVYELEMWMTSSYTDQGTTQPNFLEKVKSFYWLDGGHTELTTKVWITEKKVLTPLANLGSEIQVHVTPWQIHDSSRPHIGEQERIFVDTLKALGANVTEHIHFPDEKKFLNHFKLLAEF